MSAQNSQKPQNPVPDLPQDFFFIEDNDIIIKDESYKNRISTIKQL